MLLALSVSRWLPITIKRSVEMSYIWPSANVLLLMPKREIHIEGGEGLVRVLNIATMMIIEDWKVSLCIRCLPDVEVLSQSQSVILLIDIPYEQGCHMNLLCSLNCDAHVLTRSVEASERCEPVISRVDDIEKWFIMEVVISLRLSKISAENRCFWEVWMRIY